MRLALGGAWLRRVYALGGGGGTWKAGPSHVPGGYLRQGSGVGEATSDRTRLRHIAPLPSLCRGLLTTQGPPGIRENALVLPTERPSPPRIGVFPVFPVGVREHIRVFQARVEGPAQPGRVATAGARELDSQTAEVPDHPRPVGEQQPPAVGSADLDPGIRGQLVAALRDLDPAPLRVNDKPVVPGDTRPIDGLVAGMHAEGPADGQHELALSHRMGPFASERFDVRVSRSAADEVLGWVADCDGMQGDG